MYIYNATHSRTNIQMIMQTQTGSLAKFKGKICMTVTEGGANIVCLKNAWRACCQELYWHGGVKERMASL